MPPKKKKALSRAESLQWALRKRGIVRPSGTVPQMELRLQGLIDEEERVKEERSKAMKLAEEKENARKASISNGSSAKNNGNAGRQRHRSGSVAELEDRLEVVLWRRPFQTLSYFIHEVPCAGNDAWNRFVLSLYDSKKHRIPPSRKFLISLTIGIVLYAMHFVFCRDDAQSNHAREMVHWYGYWIFLGILSSVGLGTGLHTFVLYLGPFIAKVALAAQECQTLEFPKPPYPDQVLCPEEPFEKATLTMLDIITKVRWESLMWGFGTALGELPPFFMARAARVSGIQDDEDLEKFAELLQRKKRADPKSLSLLERGKLFMEDLVEKVGFWGILACASIPNPLFDLAGITCGHFLVPFTTFFGATVLGKAVIKAHIQMAFVIIAFNEDLLDHMVNFIRMIPHYGPGISEPFAEFMNHQKANLHNKTTKEPGHLAWFLDKIVVCVVIYFVISIINSMAQSYHKRLSKENKPKPKHKSS